MCLVQKKLLFKGSPGLARAWLLLPVFFKRLNSFGNAARHPGSCHLAGCLSFFQTLLASSLSPELFQAPWLCALRSSPKHKPLTLQLHDATSFQVTSAVLVCKGSMGGGGDDGSQRSSLQGFGFCHSSLQTLCSR